MGLYKEKNVGFFLKIVLRGKAKKAQIVVSKGEQCQ